MPINYKYGKWGAYFFDVHTGVELPLDAVKERFAELESENARLKQELAAWKDEAMALADDLGYVKTNHDLEQELAGLKQEYNTRGEIIRDYHAQLKERNTELAAAHKLVNEAREYIQSLYEIPEDRRRRIISRLRDDA